MIREDDWRYDAACRGMPTELFYSCMSSTDRDAAKAICKGCPVRTMCFRTVMAEEASDQSPAQNLKNRYGVRAGLAAGERWALAYPEAAEAARKKEAGRTRGRPSRVIQDLDEMTEEAA